MSKDWSTMSREEKGDIIRQIISLFEDDEKIAKIAYDYVNLPYVAVYRVVREYLALIDKIDEIVGTT